MSLIPHDSAVQPRIQTLFVDHNCFTNDPVGYGNYAFTLKKRAVQQQQTTKDDSEDEGSDSEDKHVSAKRPRSNSTATPNVRRPKRQRLSRGREELRNSMLITVNKDQTLRFLLQVSMMKRRLTTKFQLKLPLYFNLWKMQFPLMLRFIQKTRAFSWVWLSFGDPFQWDISWLICVCSGCQKWNVDSLGYHQKGSESQSNYYW